MTAQEFDELIVLCDITLDQLEPSVSPNLATLAALGMIATPTAPVGLVRIAVEQRRREFKFMRELWNK